MEHTHFDLSRHTRQQSMDLAGYPVSTRCAQDKFRDSRSWVGQLSLAVVCLAVLPSAVDCSHDHPAVHVEHAVQAPVESCR